MGRKIVIDTDDLKDMLDRAKEFKYVKVYDSDSNTDGESVWHCDVEFFDDYDDGGDPMVVDTYSFDEARDEEPSLSSSLSAPAQDTPLQERLELCADMFDNFYLNAQAFIDKRKEMENEQD